MAEPRDRRFENQTHRASGLNLRVAAIILWNTRYLEMALADSGNRAFLAPKPRQAHRASAARRRIWGRILRAP